MLAAGAGRRVGAEEPKAFLPIGGRPILAVAVGCGGRVAAVERLIVAAPPGGRTAPEGCVEGCGGPPTS